MTVKAKMNAELTSVVIPERPYLTVKSPDNQQFIVSLKNRDCLAIGRSQQNDLILNNPERFISREHCRIESKKDYYWIVDDDSGISGQPSTSGTFLHSRYETAEIDVREKGRIRLRDGDKILILAKILSDDTPCYWQLIFHDSLTTKSENKTILVYQIAYSFSIESLMRVAGGHQEMIKLRPNQRALIRYMARKNQANNRQTKLCTYRELIEAVWGSQEESTFGKTNGDINHLIYGIRKEIEKDPSEPKYLQTIKCEGYILDVRLID